MVDSAAHMHNVEERDSQWRHISYSLFAKNRSPYAMASHVTVWLGDLNYRLHGISTLAARSLIHKNLHSVSKYTISPLLGLGCHFLTLLIT